MISISLFVISSLVSVLNWGIKRKHRVVSQSRIMAEIEAMRQRLKEAETSANEFEAELTVLKGKLRAAQEPVSLGPHLRIKCYTITYSL